MKLFVCIATALYGIIPSSSHAGIVVNTTIVTPAEDYTLCNAAEDPSCE